MKHLQKALLLLTIPLFVGVSSCSKEKQIERRLQKKEGKWNIDKLIYEEFEDNALVYTETLTNGGSFNFDENTVVLNIIESDGSEYAVGGTWSNTKETLTIIIDGDAIVFDITEDSKKAIKLVGEENYSGASVTYRDVYTYELSRVD